ncbi:MAG: hypothetical protein LVS60_06905 [Nodosilinea sp. LVE1205-7]|jgi:hypothetical protein
MDLDSQIDLLLRNTEEDGLTVAAVSPIAPLLKAIAEQLKHRQYYVLKTLEQGWLMTTLSNSNQPTSQKTVVYAYPTLKDAAASQASSKDPQVMALPVPIIHLLFQLLAMQPIDSLIFYEQSGQAAQGIEIRRQDLELLVQAQLQPQSIPPDLA